jgi:hypothetical protein
MLTVQSTECFGVDKACGRHADEVVGVREDDEGKGGGG